MKIIHLLKPSGSLGATIAALGCTSCFPALASIAGVFGLGFLAQYEGLMINTLLPLFASISLASYLYSGIRNRQWQRMLLGIAGPLMVLATLYLFWFESWSTPMFYLGLVLMLVSGLWDLTASARGVCVSRAKRSAN